MGEPKRYTSKKPDHVFFIDDDEFHAIGAIPAEQLKDLSKKLTALSSDNLDEQFAAIKDVMSTILLPESYEVFNQRLSDQRNPVTIEVMAEVATDLVGEVYGQRPTQSLPSLPEKPGSESTSSTDGVPVTESTLENSPGTDTLILSTTG